MSEEKSKGISLRRKKTTRPTISAPRQITTPSQTRDRSADSRNPSLWETQTNGSGTTNLSIPAGRPSEGGDKTSDLVKRRYSTRFTGGVPQYNEAGLVPAVPGIPAQFATQGRRSGEHGTPLRDGRSPERGGSGLAVDPRALKDPNLQAEKYVQTILANATEEDIHAYQKELQSAKAHTSTDLQHNVYQNRTQFIKISNEADKLKSEMRTLRTLMSELTGALRYATSAGGGLHLPGESNGGDVGLLSVADRKRANRSSVANLEAMWSTHLQTLWKRVEGSQKYLPALPGRHIVMESQRWVELNAATWKPKRRVAVVLLNDHLLVASEKKRNDLLPGAGQTGASPNLKGNKSSVYNSTAQTQTTLIAERCWAIQDVSLADISTPASTSVGHNKTQENKIIANAINIRAGNESFTYSTSDNAEKAGLLVAFRKAQEDQRKVLAAEHGEREKQLDELALRSGRDPWSLKKAAAEDAEKATAAGGGLNRSDSVLVDVDGRQQSIRWVEAQIDKLDIDIALQRFEDAVAHVEKLRKLARGVKGNATAQDLILAKVDERASRLANSIARQLVHTSSGTERTKKNVSWLLRLGHEEMARTKYLDSRTETTRLRTRALPFTGALPPYLHALAFTTFRLLLHTFRTFTASFPTASSSTVVKWAKERVDEFNDALERQVSTVDRRTELWVECMRAVREQAGMLSEVGVDFSMLVGRGLEDVVVEGRQPKGVLETQNGKAGGGSFPPVSGGGARPWPKRSASVRKQGGGGGGLGIAT